MPYRAMMLLCSTVQCVYVQVIAASLLLLHVPPTSLTLLETQGTTIYNELF